MLSSAPFRLSQGVPVERILEGKDQDASAPEVY